MSSNSFALVGNPAVPRRDTLAKITGKKRFTVDIQPSDIGISATTNFVYMGYVTCPYPNALIKSIDVSAAEAAGAVTLTGMDTDFLPEYMYYSTSGNRVRGPLPTTQARYAGCPVVAVGAASPDLLNDAIELVKVEYEPLPYVFDVEGALAPGAPAIWPGGNSPGGSIVEGVANPSSAQVAFGNADAAIATATSVVTMRLDTQFIQHMDIEPRGCIAQWTGGNVNVWGNTQYAASLKTTIANYFTLPAANVTIRTSLGGNENASIGTGLGNKSSGEEYIIATAMSKKSGGVVKFMHTRTTNSLATTNRYPERGYLTGAAQNGVITAFKAVIYANVGANGGANSDLGAFYAIYNVNNINLVSYSANSNAYGLAGPMRDVGESQNHWYVETMVDMLAEKEGVDPSTFRLNNMRTAAFTDTVTGTVYPNTAFDHTTAYPYSGYGQPDCHLKATRAFNFSGRWQGWGTPSAVVTNSGETVGTGKKLRGVGIALTSGAKGALSAPDTGQIKVMPSGAITMYSGGMDHGGGGVTALPIIAAELLGQPNLSNMTAVMSDTSLTTDTGVTAGSRMTRNGGIGLVAAAQNLANQWFPLLVPKMAAGTKSTNLAFGGGTSGQPSGIIYDITNPKNQMTFAAACALLPATGLTGSGTFTPPAKTAYRVGGTKICEVEVDTETADVRVIDYVGALGLGRVIFAAGADGQNQGGFLGLGVGETFFEQSLNDSSTGLKYSGGTLNPNYLDNKITTIYQTPNRALSLWSEYNDPYGPFGAVGIGENTLMSVIPTILNALSNALGGYRFTHTPVRKEDIVTALQWMKANGKL
jgi:CO/xanthine dehydrogenase Mo-binding subunit